MAYFVGQDVCSDTMLFPLFCGFFKLALELQLWEAEAGSWFLSVPKQGLSFSNWEVGLFLCSFVSQSPGALQTWTEYGGFPGGLEGLDPCFLFPEDCV